MSNTAKIRLQGSTAGHGLLRWKIFQETWTDAEFATKADAWREAENLGLTVTQSGSRPTDLTMLDRQENQKRRGMRRKR